MPRNVALSPLAWLTFGSLAIASVAWLFLGWEIEPLWDVVRAYSWFIAMVASIPLLVVLAIVMRVAFGWTVEGAKVDASERTIAEGDVVALLQSGQLHPTDLVWEAGAWTTLRDSVGLGDAAAPFARAWDRKRLVARSVGVGAGCVLVGLMLWGVCSAGSLLDWLVKG